MKQENVLVFPAELLKEIGSFQGLCRDPGPYFRRIVVEGNTRFMDREAAETDPRFKQIIPYVLIGRAGRLFSYARGKRMSEERLKGQWSIGVGGHINDRDPALFTPEENFLHALKREVNEEVAVNCAYTLRLVGALNDDSSEVGRVHFGLVYYMELERDEITKREQALTKTGLRTFEELRRDIDLYEGWAKRCIEALPGLVE